MDVARGVTIGAISIIVTTVLLSGTAVDLTQDRPSLATAGEGTVELSVETVPTESIVIRQSTSETGTYHLRSEPAVVDIAAVRGSPLLVYELEIAGLQFSSVRKYALSNASIGRMQLALVSATFEGTDEQRTYDGTLTIRVEGDTDRIIYQRNVTIEVEG